MITIPLMKNAFLNEAETRKALIGFLSGDQQLSMSHNCEAFEGAFSEFQSRKHGVLFNSGGSANLALIQAYLNMGRLKKGDRVGFSALTWSTNVMPIIQLGLIPVPIDVEQDTMNVSSSQLIQVAKKMSLKAFFITNALGFTDDLDVIQKICQAENILLMEDNCESLGTELGGVKTGNFGESATFSFFVAHHMSTIEGGMVCTDDDSLSDMLRIVRANGWDRNLSEIKRAKLHKEHGIKSDFESKYSFYDLGYNLRPTEITGFLGLYQLKFLADNIDAREKNFLQFNKFIKANLALRQLRHSHLTKVSTFALPVIASSTQKRDQYQRAFMTAGIETRPLIAGNIARQPFFKKYVKETYELPNAEYLHTHGFYCGNYPELTEKDMCTIGKNLEAM